MRLAAPRHTYSLQRGWTAEQPTNTLFPDNRGDKSVRQQRAILGSLVAISAALASCSPSTPPETATTTAASAPVDPYWRNATVYFLMTDRFANGDPANDRAVPAPYPAGVLRGFEGGDIRGVTQRIEDGYFTELGVDAIWTTPVIQNVRGSVIEGEWGRTYAYHGYWPRDWTAVDERFGTEADFAAMVRAAHSRNIRVLVDVIINHAGPVTDQGDPRWPADWVRPSEACTHTSFRTATACELSFTLQDIRTESDAPVEVPAFLVDQWRREGRLEREMAELDAFFARTGYPRAPRYYIIKWLTDWVRDYGVDGFRVDTAKHVEPEIWAELKREADIALADWRRRNPERMANDRPFYMVGEVFNYGLLNFSQARGRLYDYGDRQVDFYANGFDALINMGFATHANQRPIADQYRLYSAQLHGEFGGRGVLNYLASHDDMNQFDPPRANIRRDATRLLLSPGGVQIYYGDEVGRSLAIPGTAGDATLRSVFNWADVSRNAALLDHWRRIARFRQRHLAVGAGMHGKLGAAPFTFSRVLGEDRVVIAIRDSSGPLTVQVSPVLRDGARLRDAYTGEEAVVTDGRVQLTRARDVVLLEQLDQNSPQ
jgi:alpha-amylase